MSKILIVEDDPIISKTYADQLKEEGYEIKLALDGEEAIEKLKDFSPDLILLDLILPKKEGIEVLRELKDHEDTKNIPVIVLTNLENEDMVSKALELGCHSYLVKSEYKLEEVSKKIKEALS
jgi:DNA-binding response OmpR family regulator